MQIIQDAGKRQHTDPHIWAVLGELMGPLDAKGRLDLISVGISTYICSYICRVKVAHQLLGFSPVEDLQFVLRRRQYLSW